MFRVLVSLLIVGVAVAFSPSQQIRVNRNQFQMKSNIANDIAKKIGAALIASTMLSLPAFAVEGTSPKQSYFGDSPASSPFTINEVREDPIYSPYSPYGNREKAVYTTTNRQGGAEETKFWTAQLEESAKRVDKVPGYVAKKTWWEVTAELTRYTYNMREAMLRLSETSPAPKVASAAAKAYFVDLNDMTEWAIKKDGKVICAAYEKSLVDLATFRKAL